MNLKESIGISVVPLGVLSINNADERRCSDDKSRRWNSSGASRSARRIYFDEEMGDALTEALRGFAGDANVRVVVVTGGAPGYFIRHFSIELRSFASPVSLRASGREWPENATYNGGFFDRSILHRYEDE